MSRHIRSRVSLGLPNSILFFVHWAGLSAFAAKLYTASSHISATGRSQTFTDRGQAGIENTSLGFRSWHLLAMVGLFLIVRFGLRACTCVMANNYPSYSTLDIVYFLEGPQRSHKNNNTLKKSSCSRLVKSYQIDSNLIS